MDSPITYTSAMMFIIVWSTPKIVFISMIAFYHLTQTSSFAGNTNLINSHLASLISEENKGVATFPNGFGLINDQSM